MGGFLTLSIHFNLHRMILSNKVFQHFSKLPIRIVNTISKIVSWSISDITLNGHIFCNCTLLMHFRGRALTVNRHLVSDHHSLAYNLSLSNIKWGPYSKFIPKRVSWGLTQEIIWYQLKRSNMRMERFKSQEENFTVLVCVLMFKCVSLFYHWLHM